MKKIIFISFLAIIACFGPAAFSQNQGVIQEFTGKVTFLEPGGGWQDAFPGAAVRSGTTVSTGFNSRAILDLGSSKIEVKALTRMTLAELVRQGNTVTTTLDLNIGRVRATVETAEGATHDFKLLSSISTAAVRGTDFEYDGEILTVFDGEVVFFNSINQKRTVGRGETSRTNGLDTPTSGEAARQETATAVLYTNAITAVTGGIPSEPLVETVYMVDVSIGMQ